jgi:topoisomerase-4 subunit A
MKKKGQQAETRSLKNVTLAEALGERYLSYALSTITSRSLPDVRDGLKPVHRRLLYAMRQLKLDPVKGFKKCARVVGDVIGKYHPHGDTAVYDTMVRMAQEFSQRYPLVEGHGNFGNIDGDNAAAMRYTEARLTQTSIMMLGGLDEDAVDFLRTYDGEESEPRVLPGRFPNLLANGSSGIAVGMATNIPPHNICEICDALLHLIKFPRSTIAKLVEKVQGPDFPTGGEIVNTREEIISFYKIGKGSFRIRAKWTKEELGQGQYHIVVNEMPFQVAKSKLIERIAELLADRKLPMIADVRDESADDVRIVFVPKSRNIDSKLLMESLFQRTDLEIRFGLNMNVLGADSVPGVMNLRDILQSYLDHRHVVLVRRSKFRLAQVAKRLEVLKGYLIVYANLDKVIKIIRAEDKPKNKLKKLLKLSDVQVEAILDMRLRKLRKLEESLIEEEFENLIIEQKKLKSLLANKKKRWDALSSEIVDIKKQYNDLSHLGVRRTSFGEAPGEIVIPVKEIVERQPVTIVLSEKGWIKTIRGHDVDPKSLKYKEGDKEKTLLHAKTTDQLILFATNGRFYSISVSSLPSGRSHGEPIALMCDLAANDSVVSALVFNPDRKLVIASDAGRGFIVPEKEVLAQTRVGKQILNLSESESGVACVPVTGDLIASVASNNKLLIFSTSELPTLNKGRGVILQRFKEGKFHGLTVFSSEDPLSGQRGKKKKILENYKDWTGKRAQSGRKLPKTFSKKDFG